jgi:EmrB/QacA subfamily drug resistance transporter
MKLSGLNSRSSALAVLLLCAFAVNVDTTIVNVTLPTLSRELSASTRELQWIVDAYTLTFAAFVLAAGALGDRFGRRRLLILGLGVYLVGNAAAALSDSTTALTAWRAMMGLGAALIFPATLSTLVHLFTCRGERATAIGLWGATTGIAVALGPIVGGAVLQASGWQAAFWLKVPLAAVALVLILIVVPESGDPARPRLDRAGLLLSSLGVLVLVFTIIEAPEHGWLAARTLLGFAAAATLLVGFIVYERRIPAPLLDMRLFRNPRFSAASTAITLAFFSLFGFIFLITQYFQVLRGYGPLETGVRLLPVALSTGTAAVVGTMLAVRIGNKIVVATGLGLTATMFAWTSQVDGSTSYLEIVGQMVLLGTGMGLTTAPATEAIMGAVPSAHAGVGSGVNDTTRELGGTLGVAVLGSVFASLYAGALGSLSSEAHGASESVTAAFGMAAELGGERGDVLRHLAANGFYDGLAAACLVAAGVAAMGALAAALFLPARPQDEVQSAEATSDGHLQMNSAAFAGHIALAATATRALVDELLAKTATTFHQWTALDFIGSNGARKARDAIVERLVHRLKIDSEIAGSIIDELVDAGIAATDGGEITLTASGEARFKRIHDGSAAIGRRLYGDLPADDLDAAHRVLFHIAERANAELALAQHEGS